jgi:uncharacterized protein (TIGR02118 family)
MIKVSVMYPKSDDATFDMDYYKTKHMEIVDRTMKPTKWEIDSGMDGPYIAIGHLYFESPDALAAAMGEGGEAMADVPNFTNAQAAMQVSQVIS